MGTYIWTYPGEIIFDATSKTDAELKALHSTLGDPFKDGSGINSAQGGYPALSWE